MIKGVNKKVIEINETENIYFEKAILYIRPKMTDVPQNHLIKEAGFYLNKNIPDGVHRDDCLQKIKKILIISALICTILAAVILTILFI